MKNGICLAIVLQYTNMPDSHLCIMYISSPGTGYRGACKGIQLIYKEGHMHEESTQSRQWMFGLHIMNRKHANMSRTFMKKVHIKTSRPWMQTFGLRIMSHMHANMNRYTSHRRHHNRDVNITEAEKQADILQQRSRKHRSRRRDTKRG